ncbi:tail fiber protein [Haemophilus haemolyticus]|uniref:tail fiber protein n=1 Tax=Haemophilus haemolyticus TaxID=726 RepID=UPI0021592FB2|nr:tail fiber protein [Haemophilus haemolyticus]
MALVNKPDESIFASSAKQGEVDNFPDLLRGWGISFEQTGGIPPMEWFNFLFKRLDEKHTYLMQRGLPEWSATQDYTKGSCVQFDGVSYRALKDSKNNSPNESESQYWVRWGFTLSEIARATLTQYGITKLYTGYDSQSEDLALTPKTAYQLKQLIDSNTRALGNVIPNSKKSSAVNSNSAETVATSAAVKTAYDKGVEAKNAADNAQRSADAANNNANGRVSKWGDTMIGSLAITGSLSGGFANGLMLKNKAGGQNTSVFVDFYQTDNIPRASMWMKDAGNNSTQIEFLNTPEGADWNIDSRQNVFTITSSGNLWSKAYGWLHDKFASKSEVYAKSRFRHQWYGNHYEGAGVFDVPMGDNGVMRTIIMGATINGYAKLNLPESFNGAHRVQVMDVGSGRHVVGANIQNGNVVEVFTNGHTGLNIIAIGWYGW